MRYRITNHEKILDDFSNILAFIGGYAGYPTGRRKIASIRHSIAGLKDYPHIGSPRDDIAPYLRAIPAADKAVICFTVDDDARIVKIICVTYAGQDWQAIAGNRTEP